MDTKCASLLEGKISSEKDATELSCADVDKKVTLQSSATVLPRPTPPKPRQKYGAKPMVAREPVVAREPCTNGTNFPVVTPAPVIVNQKNSPFENALENEESEEIIPPARAIILALEQKKLIEKVSFGSLDKRIGPDSRPGDRPSRPRLEFNVKPPDSPGPFGVKKTNDRIDRKVPPQVPAKPSNVEHRRVSQVNCGSGWSGSGQRNSFLKENHDGFDSVQLLHRRLSKEFCADKLPDFQQGTFRYEDGLECWPPLSVASHQSRRRSSILMESSSSTSSLVDGFPNVNDLKQVETKSKPVISFTTEDVEFSQKTRPSHLLSPTPSPELKSQQVKRKKEAGQTSTGASRRSRSVGAPGFNRKKFSIHAAQGPKVPAKPRGRIKPDDFDEHSSSSNSSTLVVPSSDCCLVKTTYAQINQKGCFVYEWTNALQDDNASKFPQPLIRRSKYDMKCKSTDAIDDMTIETDVPREKEVFAVEKPCVIPGTLFLRRVDLQNRMIHAEVPEKPFLNEFVSNTLAAGSSVGNEHVGSLCDDRNDSNWHHNGEGSPRVCNDEQNGISSNSSSQIGSFDLNIIPAQSRSPESNSSFSEYGKCPQEFGHAENSEEHSGKHSNVHIAENGYKEDESLQNFSEAFLNEEQFNMFNNMHSFADEILQLFPLKSPSKLLSSETEKQKSGEMLETLLTAADNTQEEMADMWKGLNCSKKDGSVTPTSSYGDSANRKTLLRSSCSSPVEAQQKMSNRKVSKAKSFKQWKRYTHKMSHRLSVKSSEKSDDNDGCDTFDLVCSDGENSDSRSESDGNDADFEEEEVLPLVSNRETERPKHQKTRSALHVASELLATERNYVKKLHLVDQVFQLEIVSRNRTEQIFSGEVIPQMFSNIKSIYLFHHDFLLPQLEKRMRTWDSDPRIGDVMKKFAPFLKLYTDYVKNFDTAVSTINFWLDRSAKFKRVIQEIQRLPDCGHLNLQHHMLEPIQRVPRYQLLLKDYLQLLPQDSPDREDTVEALDLVTKAAWHSNEVMRKTEKFNHLIEINESLGGNTDLVCPTRELRKEGKIVKISARDGSHMERYCFLFSDLLLICQSLPLKIGQKQQYRIKSRMDFDGMEKLVEGCNLETANTFYLKGRQRSVELHTSSVEEKNDWMKTINEAITDFQKNYQTEALPDLALGKAAPIWVKDPETSMCMCCSTAFTPFRRRHHCRACGDVICGKCSSKRAALVYNGNREKRVCDPCFQKLSGSANHRKDSSESVNTISSCEEPFGRKGILQVKAREPAVLSGYMNMGCNKKNLTRRFFAVHEDFVMYSFKAHQDVVAMTSLPLPGYLVARDDADERGFKVYHIQEKKLYYFQTEDEITRNRWVEAMQELVQLRLPKMNTTMPKSPT